MDHPRRPRPGAARRRDLARRQNGPAAWAAAGRHPHPAGWLLVLLPAGDLPPHQRGPDCARQSAGPPVQALTGATIGRQSMSPLQIAGTLLLILAYLAGAVTSLILGLRKAGLGAWLALAARSRTRTFAASGSFCGAV